MLEANHLGALATLVEDRLGQAFGDLSSSACALLLTLLHWQPLPVTGLAAIIGVSQPTATRVADGLVRTGMVSRGRKKGRFVELTLTARGNTRALQVARERERVLATLLAPLDDHERRQFGRLVAVILGSATGSRAQARTICRFCDHHECTGPACPVGTKARRLEAQAWQGAGHHEGRDKE